MHGAFIAAIWHKLAAGGWPHGPQNLRDAPASHLNVLKIWKLDTLRSGTGFQGL
jgi:hypothetical protein